MKSIKERGVSKELLPLQRRVRRAYSMGRISRDDFLWLDGELQKLEVFIVTMVEQDEDGEEVGHGIT